MASIVVPACSFKPLLHPRYPAIKAECESWILDLTAPPSPAASDFCLSCFFPYFTSLGCAPCITRRVVLITKFTTWFFVSDTDDDDCRVLGSMPDVAGQHHSLILACLAGKPLDPLLSTEKGGGNGDAGGGASSNNITFRRLALLRDVWKEITADMSIPMRSRFMDRMKDYLDAVRMQAEYRKANCLPGTDEYIKVVRRPASMVLPSLILLEYGLGIELDDETLGSQVLRQLHDAVTDHAALYNDILSVQAEVNMGDYLNLPSVIMAEMAVAELGFTFDDALRKAVGIVEEVDKKCAQLMAEAEKSGLAEKPGMKEYLGGLACIMAGNVEWSRRTARYTHSCSSLGIVTPLPAPPLPVRGSPCFTP